MGSIFWNMTLNSKLKVIRHFVATFHFHFQCWKLRQARKQPEAGRMHSTWLEITWDCTASHHTWPSKTVSSKRTTTWWLNWKVRGDRDLYATASSKLARPLQFAPEPSAIWIRLHRYMLFIIHSCSYLSALSENGMCSYKITFTSKESSEMYTLREPQRTDSSS
jgi:hypothetical protein